MNYLKIFLLSFLGLGTTTLFSQGCSDAGFCTIGSHFNGASNDTTLESSSNKHFFRVTPSIGLGEESTLHFITALEVKYQVNSRFAVQAKLPFQANFNDLANSYGLGNLILLGSTGLVQNENHKVYLNTGFSISLGNANQMSDSRPLPMALQSSLGTIDIVATLNYRYKGLSLTTGIQQPIIDYNNNSFIPLAYVDNQDQFELANKFPISNGFQRKGDFMLRTDYTFVIKNKVFITPGLLFLYHLDNDEFRNPLNTDVEILNSNGITLNIAAGITYKASKRSSIGINVGSPIITREVRPDGLTRALVISPFYQFNF